MVVDLNVLWGNYLRILYIYKWGNTGDLIFDNDHSGNKILMN